MFWTLQNHPYIRTFEDAIYQIRMRGVEEITERVGGAYADTGGRHHGGPHPDRLGHRDGCRRR
jgi:hypothetical protein